MTATRSTYINSQDGRPPPPPGADSQSDSDSTVNYPRSSAAPKAIPSQSLTHPLVAKSSNPQFQTNTLAPSPSPPPQPQVRKPNYAHERKPAAQDTTGKRHHTTLHIATDLGPASADYFSALNLSPPTGTNPLNRKPSANSLKQVSRTPSLRAALASSFGAPPNYGPASAASSVVASPILAALGEVTPLPSPLMVGDSPGPWHKLHGASSSPQQTPSRLTNATDDAPPDKSIDAESNGAQQRKPYGALGSDGKHPLGSSDTQHSRSRSISDYVPDTPIHTKRLATVSNSHAKPETTDTQEPHIRRELNLAQARGLASLSSTEPTTLTNGPESSLDNFEYFEAVGRQDQKRRRWRAVRKLGQGTFSRVMLATSQMSVDTDESESSLDRKALVAVKVCEQGPKGGASEERVEMSLKRELEILQLLHHPSLVDLKAWSIEPTRAILVLGYSYGGDLFDFATQYRQLLSPPLLRRMFAELVGAVHYLHQNSIVHRDIKLESKF